MTLIASDGYEYQDLKARILGTPLENVRNRQIVSYQFHRKPEGFIRAFYEAFDQEIALSPGVSTRRACEVGIDAAYHWVILDFVRRTGTPYPAP